MSELATRPPQSTPERALAGEIVDPGSLTVRAAEVAARQRSPETRRPYAAVYRAFGGFLGPDAAPADLTPEAVRAYRDALERDVEVLGERGVGTRSASARNARRWSTRSRA